MREENRLEKYQSTETPPDVMSSCLRMVKLLREEVKATELLIKAHIKAHETLLQDYSLLLSIPGVGPQLGINMLVVLHSHHFESGGQVAAFLGVAPVEKRSGTSVRGKSRMSKIGPPQIRAKLYMCALCARRCNRRVRSFYDELCLRGKPKMVAIGAVMTFPVFHGKARGHQLGLNLQDAAQRCFCLKNTLHPLLAHLLNARIQGL